MKLKLKLKLKNKNKNKKQKMKIKIKLWYLFLCLKNPNSLHNNLLKFDVFENVLRVSGARVATNCQTLAHDVQYQRPTLHRETSEAMLAFVPFLSPTVVCLLETNLDPRDSQGTQRCRTATASASATSPQRTTCLVRNVCGDWSERTPPALAASPFALCRA